jgi:hypothetical protein
MGFDLGSLLSQFTGGGSAANAADHFDKVAQSASPDLLSQGLSAMFRSDQTPSFGQMAGQLFGQANPSQQAGMLNQILAGMGPGVLASLINGTQGGGVGSILGQLTQGGTAPAAITPDQASKLTPEQVQVIASHAEQHNPGIVDEMSGFYAQHAGLIKTLGGAALTIALAKMAERHQG